MRTKYLNVVYLSITNRKLNHHFVKYQHYVELKIASKNSYKVQGVCLIPVQLTLINKLNNWTQ